MSRPQFEIEDGVRLPPTAKLVQARQARLRAAEHLQVQRDLLECDVDLGGSLEVSGTLRGGSVVVGGVLACAVLGGGEARTRVWIGAPAELQRPVVLEGEKGLEGAMLARKQSEDLIQIGREDPDSLDHERRELLTLAEFELPDLVKAERSLEWRIRRIRAFYDTGKVTVSKRLCAGVELQVGLRPERFRCVADLAGPLVLEAVAEEPFILTLDAADTPLDRHPAFERIAAISAPAAA